MEQAVAGGISERLVQGAEPVEVDDGDREGRDLERALEGGPAFVLARARIEPEWDGVRDSARFARLVATR